jgi:two-component system NtrC family response regulator
LNSLLHAGKQHVTKRGARVIYLVRSAGEARHPTPLGAKSEFVLGRAPECDVVLDDPSVSRRHLRLRLLDGHVHLEDLDSSNGLWVDGKRVAAARLELGKWFAAGNVLLTVRHGLTFGSRSSSTRPAAPSTAVTPVIAAAVVPAAPPPAGYAHRLLDALLDAQGRRGLRLGDLLEAVVRCEGLEGAEALALSSAGWVSLASVGRPFPDAGTLVELPPTAAEVLRTERGRVLRRPVLRDGRVVGMLLAWLGSAEATTVEGFDVVEGYVAREVAAWEALGERAASPLLPEIAGFVTACEPGRKLLSEIDRLAATSLPVLLAGESGTGKELLAHRLHRRSRRANGPFVALNCAAFPKDLVEAELFGIQKGVATGVGERTGRFVQASGGTLFLDEVGDLPLELQPKLLRALESGEVLPLGAPAPVKVDVRIVAATNAELREAVKEKRFRQDLLYRLAGAEVRVAPLRERPEDVLPLARHFAKEAAESHGVRFQGIDVDAASALIGYAWPGNVRELRHVIARAVALADGPILHEELLPAEITGTADRTLGDALLGLREDWRTANDAFARLYFSQLIERCDGNMTEAARRAGLGRSTLYAKLGELGVKPRDDFSG